MLEPVGRCRPQASYLFARKPEGVSATLDEIGNRGKIVLPDLTGMRRVVLLGLFVPLLAGALSALDGLTG